MHNRLSLAVLLFLSAGLVVSAWAESSDDAALIAKGKRIYLKCQSCHDITETKLDRIGPNLKGIVGRKVASVEGFPRYSKTLRALNSVWDDESLSAWLEDPESMTPGTTMAFIGIPKPEDRKALIAYMKSAK